MKKILVGIVTFLFGITLANAETTKKNVEFVRCVDGDTAVFTVDGTETKFRFLAIDTPETVHPTKTVEEFGKDASEYTCNKLTNATYIVVEYEESNKVDKYGRSLGWIWVDGSLLQKELVSVGYAEVAYIYGTYKYTESLCVVQQGAKESKYGIWSESREEGYCATLDLSKLKDTINEDYDKTVKDDTEITDEEEKAVEEKLTNTIEKVTNTIEEFDNTDIGAPLTYIIVGAAILYILKEAVKNKK